MGSSGRYGRENQRQEEAGKLLTSLSAEYNSMSAALRVTDRLKWDDVTRRLIVAYELMQDKKKASKKTSKEGKAMRSSAGRDASTEGSRRSQKEPRRCFKCYKKGHLSSDCQTTSSDEDLDDEDTRKPSWKPKSKTTAASSRTKKSKKTAKKRKEESDDSTDSEETGPSSRSLRRKHKLLYSKVAKSSSQRQDCPRLIGSDSE